MRRPRKLKTIDDLTRLEGTEYYQLPDGVTFYTADIAVDAQITLGDLLAKFYRINRGQKPLAVRLQEDTSRSITEKIYLIVWRGNFHMEVDKGRETIGPHCCKLWFRSFSTKQPHWIATLQVMAFYFNEEEIVADIKKAMNDKTFFMLPQNHDRPIMP